MYSQNSEEEVIVKHFGTHKGTFLDIGAYDGKKFSNIYRLCELGWNGVCIEPSPIVFTRLMNNMESFKTVKLVNCAIGIESRIAKFMDTNGDAISTFSESHKHKWESKAGVKFRDIWLKTITLREIFNTFGYDFAFLNLDVENQNLELFNDLLQYLPVLKKLDLICIEHDSNEVHIENTLNKFGFRPLLRNGENLILGKY